MSQSPPNSVEKTGGKLVWLLRVGGALLALAVGFLLLSFIVVVFGQVSGEEFSANTFQRRSFFYYEIPLLHWQVTAVRRNDTSNLLEKHLADTNMIGKPSGVKTSGVKKRRWDLVYSNRSDPDSALCDANILCEYLDRRDGHFELHWLTWSHANPELANVFWPAVAEVARQELYLFVPDLVQAVKGIKQPKPLKRQLDLTLNLKYRDLAEIEQKLGRHKTAERWFTKALTYQKSDVDSLRGRAKSLKALGKQAQASADLAEVQRLSNTSR